MKHVSLLMVTMLLFGGTNAQRFLTEVFPAFTKTANITYASNYTVLSGSPVLTNLTCDIYQPSGMTDTMAQRPLIILLHSGSFLPPYFNGQLLGSREDSGLVTMCRSFAKRGYVVANIDYRLGWNPYGSTVDIRRGTIIQATYRAVQDVKSAVRFFRKDAGTTNTYRIDSNRVIVGGTYTGGLVAVNYGVLVSQSQISIPKFISNVTDATYGYQAGQPYINAAIMGDLDGYGGNAAYNNPNNSPGYNGRPNFIFSFEGVVGDSSWVVPGLPPMVSLHRVNNNQNSPYGNGIIYVFPPAPIPPQSIVDVSGSGIFIPLTNLKGNNSCFRPNNFTDPYTQKAMSLSGGQEGLYPLMHDSAGVIWFDSVSAVTECQLYGLSAGKCDSIYTKEATNFYKAKALLYIDTLMGYLNPRIVKCLNLVTTGVEDLTAPQNNISIFPNPSTGSITINALNGIEAIAVKDITGKTLLQLSAKREQILQLQLGQLPAGIYIIIVQTGKATVTRRLSIE